jgi:hypothetical protein
MAMMAAAEAFLARHLGGRFQQGGTPEVVARLKELTVDPRTVVLAKKVDAATVGAPKPLADLTAGESSYKGTIEAGTQSMAISAHRAIEAEGGTWVITDTVTMPMGVAVDITTVEKGSLIVTRRSVKQGPVTIELTFADGKVTGTLSMGAEPKPIAADLGGPLFADGAGSWEAVARLPLAEGYAVTYRNFDIQKQKPALMQVKVVGSEEITVAAGTFATWKAEATSAEGEPGSTTIWVAKDSRQVVKTSMVLPQMGGATVTSELQP